MTKIKSKRKSKAASVSSRNEVGYSEDIGSLSDELNTAANIPDMSLSGDDKEACMKLLRNLDFRKEIQSLLEPLHKALPSCLPCDCSFFYEDEIKPEEQVLEEAKSEYECSSEASSAFVSLVDLDEEDANRMIEAARLNEERQRNIMYLPFNEEYLCVKSLKEKEDSEESESQLASYVRPEDEINMKYARPAWVTGLHDPIGIGAYEWEKLVKEIIGQGRYGRTSSREPFFRFELPINLEKLKDISPLEYLERYCVISERRQALYQKEFAKHREPKASLIYGSVLFKALNNIMVGTLLKEQYESICEMLQIDAETKLNMQVFCGICAVTERLFFSINLTSNSEEAYEIQKGFIEAADFTNLKSKLKNMPMPENVEKLIYSL